MPNSYERDSEIKREIETLFEGCPVTGVVEEWI
jgi:hypothetical protein